MIRRAFIMRLKPEAMSEYRRRHESIWPELVAEVERSGIASISSFARGDEVIVVSEVADAAAWQRLWESDVHRRWTKLMEPLVAARDEHTLEAAELAELFHIETQAAEATSAPTRNQSDGQPPSAQAASKSQVDGARSRVSDMIRQARQLDGATQGAVGAHAKAPCAPDPAPKHKMAARSTRQPAVRQSTDDKGAPRTTKAKRKTTTGSKRHASPRSTKAAKKKRTKPATGKKSSAKKKTKARKAAPKTKSRSSKGTAKKTSKKASKKARPKKRPSAAKTPKRRPSKSKRAKKTGGARTRSARTKRTNARAAKRAG